MIITTTRIQITELIPLSVLSTFSLDASCSALSEGAAVTAASSVGAIVSLGSGVGVLVSVGSGVGVLVSVGSGVGVLASVGSGAGVLASVGSGAGVLVSVGFGAGVLVFSGFGVGVPVGSASASPISLPSVPAFPTSEVFSSLNRLGTVFRFFLSFRNKFYCTLFRIGGFCNIYPARNITSLCVSPDTIFTSIYFCINI